MSANDLQSIMTRLPDGSGFFTADYPLPHDHWLYQPIAENHRKTYGEDEGVIHPFSRTQAIEAFQWAIKDATACGTIKDFDPDALVQNLVFAMFGSGRLMRVFSDK